MRRPNRIQSRQVPALLLIAALAASASAAGAVRVWPRPPADPVVRLESVLAKLDNFEIAVQGPTEAPPRRVQKLKRPSGIAFDARGRLVVSDARQGVLLQIDPDLGVVLVLGSGTTPTLQEPRGVAIHPDGTIYVADAGLRRIVAFDRQGEVTSVYGDDGLLEPTDVALSPDGSRLYVVDSNANNIAIFDVAGRRQIETLGTRGVGVGEFILPTAVEFDSAGNLMIVDQLNGRVQIFDPNGEFTRALYFDRFSRPYDVAADSTGRVYVTDRGNSLIQVYDPDLEPLLTVGRNGLRQGEFLGIGGVAVGGDQMAALDQAGGRIQLFELPGLERTPATERNAPSTWKEPLPAAAVESSEPLEAVTLKDATEPEVDAPAPSETAQQTAPPADQPAVDEPTEVAVEEPEAPAAPDEIAVAQELIQVITDWADAWSAQDAERYLAFYAQTFEPADGASREDWSALRRSRVTSPSSIAVEIEIAETVVEAGGVEISLIQSYTSDRFSDRVRKKLLLVREDGVWKIDRETVIETL